MMRDITAKKTERILYSSWRNSSEPCLKLLFKILEIYFIFFLYAYIRYSLSYMNHLVDLLLNLLLVKRSDMLVSSSTVGDQLNPGDDECVNQPEDQPQNAWQDNEDVSSLDRDHFFTFWEFLLKECFI